MNNESAKSIDYYYGEYKKSGLFSKKFGIKFGIYPSHLEGMGFSLYDTQLSDDLDFFKIPYEDVLKIYIGQFEKEKALFIEYSTNTVVKKSKSTIVLLGISDLQRWFDIAEETKNRYFESKMEKQQLEAKRAEEQNRLAAVKEGNAQKFYQECYSFHIRESTPVYQLFSDKNRVALIYIDKNKSLNFLKIDGYGEEENNGVIAYEDIHYYERAGNVSYATDIHGSYSSFGGSMTGGSFSKLATAGGGLLFGLMGMAIGAALTYKPAEQKSVTTSFSIDSDIKKIDDRSVMLNFYSDIKKQYVDIELPHDIYNFLQTYLPEKKFAIVDELEKKTVVHQSADVIQNSSLLKVPVKPDNNPPIEEKEAQQTISMEEFKQKVEKLRIMKEAGLLSDEKFKEEQDKLLNMI